MTTITVGSTAARYWLGEQWRVPRDVDLYTDNAVWRDLTEHDVVWHPSWYDYFTRYDCRFATLDELYTIKVSHSHWVLPNGPGNWDKHIADIVKLQDLVPDIKLIPELYYLLYCTWQDRLGHKQVNLSLDYERFFDDNVERVYDHDSVHEAVCYGERPAYEKYFAANSEIGMDMAKVWAAPHEDIVTLFTEEVLATALERYIIPGEYGVSPGLAYKLALRKTITSLTKGRSSRFMIENYRDFMRPDREYVNRYYANMDKLRAFGVRG